MSESAALITADSIAFVHNNRDYTIAKNHPKYDDIRQAVENQDWDKAVKLTDTASVIRKFGMGKITVENGNVVYNNEVLHGTLTTRILDQISAGYDAGPMMRFLENLMENPSFRSVEQLYNFMEQGLLPITTGGELLAYKRVREDYKDIYTGKIDNSVGSVVEMDRNRVSDDSNEACSSGLHFCSVGYLGSYGTSPGSRTMIIKVNPKDVVSIPVDHNHEKARCCRYEVVGEHDGSTTVEGGIKDTLADSPVFTSDAQKSEPEDYNAGYEDGYTFGADESHYKGETSVDPETQYSEIDAEDFFVDYQYHMDDDRNNDEDAYYRGFHKGFLNGWLNTQDELDEDWGGEEEKDDDVESGLGTTTDYKKGYKKGYVVGHAGQRLTPPLVFVAELSKRDNGGRYTTMDYRKGFEQGFLHGKDGLLYDDDPAE